MSARLSLTSYQASIRLSHVANKMLRASDADISQQVQGSTAYTDTLGDSQNCRKEQLSLYPFILLLGRII